MPLNRYRFYMGVPGNMIALPALPKGSNPEASPTLAGVEHISLSGRHTLDVRAFKRTFVFNWKYLSQTDLLFLVAFYRRTGIAPGTNLRLHDLRHVNGLSAQVSTGGSESDDITGFTNSGGTLTQATTSGLPFPLSLAINGAITLVATATGQTVTNIVNSPVETGATYLFSAYAMGSGSFTPQIYPFDSLGNALTVVSGTPVALTGAWPSTSNGVVTRWIPPSNAASFKVGWSSNGVGTLNTTAWQVETDPASALTPATFYMGHGIAQVYVKSMTKVYPYKDFYTCQFVVQEI